MDRKVIAAIAQKMETPIDLLKLLNRLKKDEMREMGLEDSYHPFTMKLFNYYRNPKNIFHRYKQFQIPKKNGGYRQITAPRNRSFMLMLRYLNEILKSIYQPSDCAMGFTEGRSVASNAAIHIGQNYVFNIDLKDFFPSIEQARVWKRIQAKPFYFSANIANCIAGMCSMQVIRTEADGSEKVCYVLPQGAPTSPIVTNMICDKLDRRLAGLAKRFGLHYSRYADDITFSSMHNVYGKKTEFRKELCRIITDQGFIINDKKTRLQKKGTRQEVTGIIVNEKANVTKKYVREIRDLLYIWEKYGITVAIGKFYPKYKKEKGHVKKGNPNIINVLSGKLMYLKMVKGESDEVFMKLNTKFEHLVDITINALKTTESLITYEETVSLKDFEKRNNTSVTITTSYTDNGKETNAISNDELDEYKGHRYAYFILDGVKVLATVSRSIDPEDENKKDMLAISLCLDKKKKEFWLVHKKDKVTVQTVDIDLLNDELDSLLNT